DGQRPPYQQRTDGQRPPYQQRTDGQRPPYQQRTDGQRPPYQQRTDGQRPPYQQRTDGQRPPYQQRQDGQRSRGPSSERKNFDQQILDQKVAEKNESRKNRERSSKDKDKVLRDRNIKNKRGGSFSGQNRVDLPPKKGQFIKPTPIQAKPEDSIKTIVLPEVLTLKELADKMKMPGSVLVKKLFLLGEMVSINHEITFDEAEEIALEYDIIAEKEVKVDVVANLLKEEEEDEKDLTKRPPVVCVMGHVDHGKTSLLDAIRETHVTTREAGGITQHIGAYVVTIDGESIAFLDTPGHEAFTSMRMRGAKSTDIAILVVAADDGVMPQTIEAINHAKAAGVEIIVAVNKIDKPSANVDKVKQELTEHGLVAEDWGGDTIFVPVSAHTKEGIDSLLEMIVLTSELLELKANPNRNARGIVIEAELDKGRGPVATVLVQKGTLKVGDNIVIGAAYGKVRAMMDDLGERVETAGPSTPVEILGLNDVPNSGEIIIATDSEKEARSISDAFITQGREKLLSDTKSRLSLDGLFSQIKAGSMKDFNLIIKADVQGSVEAMRQSLIKLCNEEVVVRVIHGGVGAINESDVILASASNAIIIGFNVKPDNAAKDTSDREKVEIKLYRVIYHAIEDVEAAIKGMLEPIFEEKVIGHAEVRQTFKSSGIGTIAGSYVLDGKIKRGCKARITRDKKIVFDGPLASLKRFQDDVKEVATNYECGLVFEKYNDVQEGDLVELYIMAEVAR
ncbi:MAG TPA: translation initiation factor IF-2, partial [Clostridiales bacterium]|nr:translation initiation factor IF-2 [Clostridiales bacterium]